jgi:malonate decarboxylase alpha subunit
MLVPSRHQADRPARLARAGAIRGASGKLWPADRATELLEAIIESGDRVGGVGALSASMQLVIMHHGDP